MIALQHYPDRERGGGENREEEKTEGKNKMVRESNYDNYCMHVATPILRRKEDNEDITGETEGLQTIYSPTGEHDNNHSTLTVQYT